MDRVCLTGRLLPEAHTFTLGGVINQTIEYQDSRIAVSLKIINSIVLAECDVDGYKPEILSELCRMAYRMAKAATDLVAFRTGMGLTLVFDKVATPNGSGRINFEYPDAAKICTAYNVPGESLTEMLLAVLPEHRLLFALNDLTDTIAWFDCIEINCARALETIRTLIDPGDRSTAWASLHSALNCTREYAQFITNPSRSHRHGQYEETTFEIREEIRSRTWTLMNRFLVLKKTGAKSLPLTDFPLLG